MAMPNANIEYTRTQTTNKTIVRQRIFPTVRKSQTKTKKIMQKKHKHQQTVEQQNTLGIRLISRKFFLLKTKGVKQK